MKSHILIGILFVLVFAGYACSPDELISGEDVKEGIPVKATFNFSTNFQSVSTRALTESQEHQVNDIYILIFNSSKRREFGRRFSSSEITDKTKFDGTNLSTGKIKVDISSGVKYIYAIANVRGGIANASLETALAAVQSVDELKEVTVELNSNTVDRNTAALVMSGTFEAAGATEDQKARGYCVIPEPKVGEDVLVSGKIVFSRLDSRFEFILKSGPNGTFIPRNGQVFNVPAVSNLLELPTGCSTKKYFNSSPHLFDENGGVFYMFENRKQVLHYDGSDRNLYPAGSVPKDLPTTYKERGKRYKTVDASSGNGVNGEFIYADPNATYVKITGQWEEKLTGGGVRVADVEYIVHLGYFSDENGNPSSDQAVRAADYKSLRNHKYTYTLTINGVDDIVAEVTGSQIDSEVDAGASGDVIDANYYIFNLDAHYHTYNIAIDAGMDALTFHVMTPFANVSEGEFEKYMESKNVADLPAKYDVDWVEFKRTSSETEIATHKDEIDTDDNKSKKLLKVYELSEDLKRRRNSGETPVVVLGRSFYMYTVFVKEYFYDDAPPGCETEWGVKSARNPYWPRFVNKEDRKMILIMDTQYSWDHESSYATGEYLISQKSIQTFYSDDIAAYNIENAVSGLGVEHSNETGRLPFAYRSFYYSEVNDKEDGLVDMKSQIDSDLGNLEQKDRRSWNQYVSPIVDGDKFIPTYINRYAYAACLSRNRDEDGDGVIQDGEIKWYMPSINELIALYIGAPSLPHPLFDAAKVPSVESGKDTYHVWSNSYSQVVGNNPWKLWAEEGVATGQQSSYASALDIRCVRNLANIPSEHHVLLYDYDSNTKIFDMSRLDAASRRDGWVENNDLPVHDNFDDYNRPYRYFKVAKNEAPHYYDGANHYWWEINGVNEDNTGDGFSRCQLYSEETDKSDLGTWRVPNQRELALMYREADITIETYSRSYWKYDNQRYFGVSGGNLYLSAHGDMRNIRCVKDLSSKE